MAVDLRSNTLFGRNSLVVMDDCVVKLEHGRTEDRVRKFMFDSIDRLIVWRKVPWGRVTASVLCLLLPGALLQLPQDLAFAIPGGVMLAVGLGLVAFYLVCRHTTIRIGRSDGSVTDIKGIFRPGKVRRFCDRAVSGIRAAQAMP